MYRRQRRESEFSKHHYFLGISEYSVSMILFNFIAFLDLIVLSWAQYTLHHFDENYLTIRLRARDFYEVIVY